MKNRNEIEKQLVVLKKIPGFVRAIGYGSYFNPMKEYDSKRSDIDICIVVSEDVLATLPILRSLQENGLKIGQGPEEYHIWVLNEDSLKPSPLTNYIHPHSIAINSEGVLLNLGS